MSYFPSDRGGEGVGERAVGAGGQPHPLRGQAEASSGLLPGPSRSTWPVSSDICLAWSVRWVEFASPWVQTTSQAKGSVCSYIDPSTKTRDALWLILLVTSPFEESR